MLILFELEIAVLGLQFCKSPFQIFGVTSWERSPRELITGLAFEIGLTTILARPRAIALYLLYPTPITCLRYSHPLGSTDEF